MRDILKKTVAVVMVAGVALSLGACKSETTNTTTTIDNASMTDLNGSMSDAETNTMATENSMNAM